MLDSVFMDAKHSVCVGANPQIALAVGDHAGDADFSSVERRGHKGFDGSVFPFRKSQSRAFGLHADPKRSIRIRHEAHNLTSRPVRLRDATIPMRKSGTSSQPKPASTISQYRIDRGNRYSIIFTETLQGLVRDMAQRHV